jgi:hypothetical protein
MSVGRAAWPVLLGLVTLTLSLCSTTALATPVIEIADRMDPGVTDSLAAEVVRCGETWDIAALRSVATEYYLTHSDPRMHFAGDLTRALRQIPQDSVQHLERLLRQEITPFLIGSGRLIEYDFEPDDSARVICNVRLASADSLTARQIAEFVTTLQDLGNEWNTYTVAEAGRLYLRLIGPLIDLSEPGIEQKIAALRARGALELEQTILGRIHALLGFNGYFMRYNHAGYGEERRVTNMRIFKPQDGVDGWTALPGGRWQHIER